MLPTHDIQARNYLLACFAVSLIRGETLLGKHIRHATIRNYVNAACSLHKDRDLPSPYGAPHNYIGIVLDAVQKYEKVKDRRDMIHDEMIHHMASCQSSYHPDSLKAALLDWIYLGRFVGYRSIEWCQKTMLEYEKIVHPNWIGPDSYAFIAEDFQFYDNEKVHIVDPTTTSLSNILYVLIRFRKQKNNQNYEIIPYFKDMTNPTFCPVHAALRIRHRAIRLGVPSNEPLAKFLCTTGQYKDKKCFITNDHVATYLRSIAQHVYKLKKNDKALKKWSAHSIRVTACNLLHRQGFSDTYIQTRLRWKSNAFLGYLRNTLYSAAAHTKALHIPDNNLPTLSTEYTSLKLPTGAIVVTNSTSGPPLPRYREQEELEKVLHAGAA